MNENSFFAFSWFLVMFLSVFSSDKIFAQRHRFVHIDSRQGLSNNFVKSIYRDKTGFIWIGTESGLNRFDGYSIKIYRNNLADSSSLINDNISRLFEVPGGELGIVTDHGVCFYDPTTERFSTKSHFLDKKSIENPADVTNIVHDNAGNYWLVLNNSGLVCFNEKRKNIASLKHIDGDVSTISTNNITSFAPHHDGSYWIAHSNGIVENAALDKGKLRVVKRICLPTSMRKTGKPLHCELMIDKDGDLWSFIANVDEGVFYYNTDKNKIYHLKKDSIPTALSSDLITGLVQDDQGYIWISYNGAGIDILDKKSFSIRNVSQDSDIGTALSVHSTTTIYKDPDGIIWLGTYKNGLNFFHESMVPFPIYNRHSKRYALPFEDINHFIEDKKGNLWLGTNGGGLIYLDRSSGRFTTYRHNPKDPYSLSSNVVVSLCLDHEGKLWIGTFFGGLNCFDGGKFTRYQHRVNDSGSLSDKSVWEIFEDSKHQLWIGTLNGGVNLFNRKTKTFTRYSHVQQKALQSGYISTVTEDTKGNLWFGTSLGIDVLQKASGNIVHFESDRNNRTSLASNIITGILEDSRGRMWIGTVGGLSVWQRKTNRFTNFTEKDGLPHNTIMSMEEDADGRLWLSTSDGLACATPIAFGDSIQLRFTNYSEADGLQGQHFNEDAAIRLKTGELVFGGDKGFHIFKPKDIVHNKTIPRLVFTDFQLFNRSIHPGREETNNGPLLSSSITTNPSVLLAASDNVFSIEFAALNFIHPSKTRYKYKLEGLNDDWMLADANHRRVTFTNLDAGHYTFRVLATNNDGEWSEEGISLPIKVLPPFWKSGGAFLTYIFLLLAGFYITHKIIQKGERMKFAIKQQQVETIRSLELDKINTNFFTNVSHEFRALLSLTISTLKKLSEQVKDIDQRKDVDLMQRYAKRLLSLVNQHLDFRKMEVRDIRFDPFEGDIIQVVRDTVYSFTDLSEKKSIKLTFESSISSLEAIFDYEKVERILFNLLSNAFKFTLDSGAISVIVDVKELSENSIIEIIVKDTGIGIPPDQREVVFECFLQNEIPSSMVNQGGGIGLAVTKEFVRIHGGSIMVESEVGKGSSFIVLLPLKKIADSIPEAMINPVNNEVDSVVDGGSISISRGKPLILLVEHNEDFRLYLKESLKIPYDVIEAKMGEEGWQKTILKYPDLIITNEIMPDLNGINLCKKIKSDQRVNHIPVILISGYSDEEQWLEGFEVGAEAYMSKPLSIPILISRIRNLISLRKTIENLVEKEYVLSESAMAPLDNIFIRDVVTVIEKNIANKELTVSDLSRELGLSRAQFFRKVQELTGKSPLELIRFIRMQHAAQLLEKSQLLVSEITCRVGFTNSRYFARLFQRQYHVLPSEYARAKRRD
ncbi:hybrid sensor histidine kinase/response regulator transcription factor [Ohtaekwangia koreensis]|uniref:histidine kinase n=1 Tax=Ohtaekwangia koreensis TaxID=688867 RepID=A0A1T5KIR1_9BACT|nr:hybrid sensor histidine kinase/response regulator transcription factor [Ohtaekwangia koreensis]SKC63511.1 Signal transduction histidine kinase [Ohtaekwangia koreensis]